jgi:hypothetical protein
MLAFGLDIFMGIKVAWRAERAITHGMAQHGI